MKNAIRIAVVLIATIAAFSSCSQTTSSPTPVMPAVAFIGPTGVSYPSGSTVGFAVYNPDNISTGTNHINASADDQSQGAETYYTTDGSNPTTSSYKTAPGSFLDLLTLAQQITGQTTPTLPVTATVKFASIGGYSPAGTIGTASNPFTITITLNAYLYSN